MNAIYIVAMVTAGAHIWQVGLSKVLLFFKYAQAEAAIAVRGGKSGGLASIRANTACGRSPSRGSLWDV